MQAQMDRFLENLKAPLEVGKRHNSQIPAWKKLLSGKKKGTTNCKNQDQSQHPASAPLPVQQPAVPAAVSTTVRPSPSAPSPLPSSSSSSSRHELHSSCLLLNIQSMNPSASSRARWKVSELQSIIHEEKANNHVLPFLAITETWLKSYISDAQLHIPGYVVSRSDRDSRIGGGILL